MKKEVFKDIPNYEGYYQISNLGRVKSLERTITRRDGFVRRVCEKIIEPSTARIEDPKSGKLYTNTVFCFRKDLKTEMIPAVHVILSAFYQEYEVGTYKVIYKDGDHTNVSLNNLKFDFWNGRYGGYVEIKRRGKKTETFRSIAKAGTILKFDHTKIFDKETPDNLKGFKINFAKPFKHKRKSIHSVNL